MFNELITPESIILNLESSDKDSLFPEMVENIIAQEPSINRAECLAALITRENVQNTCIVPSIAVPHASLTGISRPVVSIGISRDGVDYEVNGGASPDDPSDYVHLVILIIFPAEDTSKKISVLSDCAKILRNENFYQTSLTTSSKSDIINVMARIEAE